MTDTTTPRERWKHGKQYEGTDIRVRVIYDYYDPDAYDEGYLEELADDGEATMKLDDGTTVTGWPFMELQVIEPPPTIEEDPI